MRLVVRKESLRGMFKWAQRGLFACAFLLLGYCGFVLVDGWYFQRRENADLDRLLSGRREVNEPTPQPFSATSPPRAPAAAMTGLIGRLEVPRLGFSVVVVEGIGRTALRRAFGHIPGTARPGEAGNVGLAGHRDTYFRPLKDLKIKDEIRFSTLQGDYKYEVESLTVVEPDDVGVLAASDENVLTMVTCYPFYFVGPAPQRYIVRARQVSPQTLARSIVE